VTAHAEAARDAGQLGADAIVEKPFDVEILGARIAELLSR